MRDAAFFELESGIAEAPRCVRDELEALSRWKSTNAPRLEALEGLLRTAQAEAKAGRDAIATLASERAANAALTDEVDRLSALVAHLSSPLGYTLAPVRATPMLIEAMQRVAPSHRGVRLSARDCADMWSAATARLTA